MTTPEPIVRRWNGPPLSLQITALLLGGLVLAQLATLVLTMLLPPEPQRQYELGDIAQALVGDGAGARDARMVRTVADVPPQPGGPGWLTSDRSRRDLARLLARDASEVRLFFFTPLPFAGTAQAPVRTVQDAILPDDAPRYRRALVDGEGLPTGFVRAGYQVAQAGPGGPGGGGFGGPGYPGGGYGGGFGGGPGGGAGGFGGRGSDFGGPGRATGSADPAAGRAPAHAQDTVAPPPAPSNDAPGRPSPAGDASDTSRSPSSAPPAATPRALSDAATAPGGGSPAPAAAPSGGAAPPASNPPPMPSSGPPAMSGAPIFRLPLPDLPERRSAPEAPASPRKSAAGTASPPTTAPPRTADTAGDSAAAAARAPSAAAQAAPGAGAPRALPPAATAPEPEASVARTPSRGLFGLAPAPFVEGDFVAAVQLPRGGWAVVQPVPEPFPNAWQRRVLLWFLIASLLVAPAGWWYSRRLARPFAGFARAAEQLGRDPRTPIAPVRGPAEVSRAAQALNGMQSRLRSFVDDRTAMIGAISHDLRTPLTRMRFRIEDAPDAVRAGMLGDVREMEDMIASVLDFLRDASEPGSRERLDLASLVEDVVEEARFVGKPARLERSEGAAVEVDAIGIRRVLDNLIENAVKYGGEARVRLFIDRLDAVAEVGDNGPGLPDDELEDVFKPFYRSRDARRSRKPGSGLGLAVCRSIARAHGGDVRLHSGPRGLIAQLRIPLVDSLADA